VEQIVRAMLFPGNGDVELTEKVVGDPGPGEVLLAMRAAGMCGSDLHFMHMSPDERRHSPWKGLDGDPERTPGHEIAGVVEEVGAGVTHLKPGDRVAVQHYSGCGFCRSCRMGWDFMCENKTVYTLGRDGGFQDKLLAAAKDCIPIPDGVSFTTAAFIACGAGTSFQAIRRGELKAGQTLLSVGLGPVGFSALMWGTVTGARTIGIDPVPERRELALSLGIGMALAPDDPELLDKIESVAGYPGADVVIETAGNNAGRRLSLEATRPWGTAVWIGFGPGCELDAVNHIIMPQITLRGSAVISVSAMMDALSFVARSGIDFDRAITHTCGIEDAPAAIKAFEAGGQGKTFIVWPDDTTSN
jgi:propanol-preferring alcohol dehydrogenase